MEVLDFFVVISFLCIIILVLPIVGCRDKSDNSILQGKLISGGDFIGLQTAIIELHCQNLNFIRSLTNDDIRECDKRARPKQFL